MRFTFFGIFLSFFSWADSSKLISKDTWLVAQNGRSSALFSSFKKDEIQQFKPSGIGPESKTLGDYLIQIYPAVYYSNSENPDTSKDKPASVIVSYKGKKQFVGKGYKFSLMEDPKIPAKPLFIIRYWSGVMGCSFTDISFQPKKKPVLQKRSTSSVTELNPLGDLC